MVVHACYTELGVTQVVDPYVMDIPHMFTFTIVVAFLMYGLYSSLRDIFILIFKDIHTKEIEDQKSNPPF